MERIFKRIRNSEQAFSKGLKKAAAYIQQDPSTFATSSAKETGKQIGVSETTIIRFANTLGYDGFRSLQQDVQQQLLQKSSLSDFRDSKITSDSHNHSVKDLMENDRILIQEAMNQLSEKDLEAAITALINADLIQVAGSRSSYSLASWFSFALDLVAGNTHHLHTPGEDVLLRITELNEKSMFVAFSFHRYAIDTINLSKLAKKQGAEVLAFTDNPYSPISDYADITLAIQAKNQSTLDLAPAVLSLLNSIVSAISIKIPQSFENRVAKFDAIDTDGIFMNR